MMLKFYDGMEDLEKNVAYRFRKMEGEHNISMMSRPLAIVIGVSAGGFKALHRILPLFDADFPLPVMIVQHRKADTEAYFMESLRNRCRMDVVEPLDKTLIEPGKIYIAPGGYHMLVESGGYLSLSVDPPVCYCRPSIDVLFESAADVFGSRLIGIILTGANIDGTSGIRMIKRSGGITIAENPETAEVNYMPLSAVKSGSVDYVVDLDEIPETVERILLSFIKES